MSHSKSKYAGQAEILRAAQKDENYIRQLNEITSNLTLLGGRKLWLKYASYHIVFSKLVYYLSTNFSSLQTLGEEYTGIIPVDKAYPNQIALQKLLLYVILLSGGHVILTSFLKNFGRIKCSNWACNYLNPALLDGMKKLMHVFLSLVPYLERINKTIFYFNGSYYYMVNRLMGVKHVLFRSWLRDEESLYGFKILGILSLINLIVSFLLSYPNWSTVDSYVDTDTINQDGQASSQNNCKLCLSPRKNTSITPCGHLFCWKCIMEWLHLRKDCPFCKSPITTSRVVFLHNYDQLSGN